MSFVFLLFFVFVCFFLIPLLFLNNRSHPLFIFIFCYLPSYPNLVNLFLIYIRNHFHFYSNQIIPFLFYFLFLFYLFCFSISLTYISFYTYFFFSHVSLYFLFSFLETINCAILIYHKQNNLK